MLLMNPDYFTDPLLCFVFCHLFLYVLVFVFGGPCFNYGEGEADDDWGELEDITFIFIFGQYNDF